MDAQDSAPSPQSKPLGEAYRLAVVLAITAATYARTLRFDFVSDDGLQIADNQYIKSWHYIPQFFVTTVWGHLYPNSPHSFYRPVFLLWNLVNYSLFGLNTVGWHAATVALFLLVTALVYSLVRKIAPERPNLAWLTALIFGVHPIHHDAVVWISGVTESLFAVFLLAGFLAYLNSRERNRAAWMLASCVCYAFAVFSKETGIVLPAMVFAYAWIADGSDRGMSARLAQAVGATLPYVPVVAIYLAMRFHVLSNFEHANVPMSAWGLATTWPSVLFFYLRQWVLPIRFAQYYDMAYYDGLNLRGVVLPAALVAAVAGGIFWARKQLGAREMSIAASWLILPLLPAMDLAVFQPGQLAHDRYFYVPSIGAAMLTAMLIERVGKSRTEIWGMPRRMVAIGLLLAGGLAACTVAAEGQWVNNLVLLTRSHQVAPKNAAVRNDLAAEWIDHGQLDNAQTLLRALVQEHPDDWMAWLNLGRVHYQKQNYAAAVDDVQHTLAVNPSSGIAYVLLGQSQLKAGHIPEALTSMHEAVRLLPLEYRFHTIYGMILETAGDCSSAMSEFSTALALHPGDEITLREQDGCRTAISTPHSE